MSDSREPSRPYPGYLIVFEGIDGTGKSTQIQRLSEILVKEGRETIQLREPTNGPHGQELRRMAVEGRADSERERQLFVADRREDVERNIVPSLKKGQIVLLDRYYFSTMAYQGARGIDPELIRRENEAFAPKPDLLVILDLPVEVALERVKKGRDNGPDEFEKADYLARVKSFFDGMEMPYLVRVDAQASREEITENILVHIHRLLERQ